MRETWTYWSEPSKGQWRWLTELKRLSYEEAEKAGTVQHKREGLGQILPMRMKTWWKGMKKDPDPSQPCSWGGQKVMGTDFEKETHEISSENKNKLFYFLWRWPDTRRGCPEKLWSLHLGRYSKLSRTESWATCSSWPCLSTGRWIRWSLEVTILLLKKQPNHNMKINEVFVSAFSTLQCHP